MLESLVAMNGLIPSNSLLNSKLVISCLGIKSCEQTPAVPIILLVGEG